MFLRSAFALGCAFAVSTSACGGSTSRTEAQAPAPRDLPEHSLSGLAAQHVVLLPTYSVRVAPTLGWSSAVGRLVDVQRTLDADLLAALEERGLRKVWIFPDDLAQWMPMFTYTVTYGFSKQLNFKPYPDELPRFFLSSWK